MSNSTRAARETTLVNRRERLLELFNEFGETSYDFDPDAPITGETVHLTLRPEDLPAPDLLPRGYTGTTGVSRSQPVLMALGRALRFGIPSERLSDPVISVSDLREWRHQLGDDNAIANWYRFGFSVNRARVWIAAGLQTPSIAVLNEIKGISPSMHLIATMLNSTKDRPSQIIYEDVTAIHVAVIKDIGTSFPDHEVLDKMLELTPWSGWGQAAIIRFREAGVPIEYADEAYAAGVENSIDIVSAYQIGLPVDWAVAAYRAKNK